MKIVVLGKLSPGQSHMTNWLKGTISVIYIVFEIKSCIANQSYKIFRVIGTNLAVCLLRVIRKIERPKKNNKVAKLSCENEFGF